MSTQNVVVMKFISREKSTQKLFIKMRIFFTNCQQDLQKKKKKKSDNKAKIQTAHIVEGDVSVLNHIVND